MHPLEAHARRSRREFLTTAAGGAGGLALAALLAQDGLAASREAVNPLAAKPPHFKPRATRCIFLFLAGGASQVDLFDPKPRLNELKGQPAPPSLLKGAKFAFIQKDSAVILGSPPTFAPPRESALAVS